VGRVGHGVGQKDKWVRKPVHGENGDSQVPTAIRLLLLHLQKLSSFVSGPSYSRSWRTEAKFGVEARIAESSGTRDDASSAPPNSANRCTVRMECGLCPTYPDHGDGERARSEEVRSDAGRTERPTPSKYIDHILIGPNSQNLRVLIYVFRESN